MPTQTARLNLTKPDQGNTNWKSLLDLWADKLDEVSAQFLSVHLGGQAVDEEILLDGLLFPEGVDITAVSFYAREAPQGASFTIDFLKNQVAQSKSVSLLQANQKGSGTVSGLSYLSTDEFGIKVTNTGTSNPGAEISIIIHYNVQPVS